MVKHTSLLTKTLLPFTVDVAPPLVLSRPHEQRLVLAHAQRPGLFPLNQRTLSGFLAVTIPVAPPPNLEGRRQLAVPRLLAVQPAAPCLSGWPGSVSLDRPLRSKSISGAESPPKSATSAMRFLLWGTPQNCASCTRQAMLQVPSAE